MMTKEAIESVNSHWTRDSQTYQHAELIVTLNLLPGHMFTVRMMSSRYHAGRPNSFYHL